MNKKLVIPAAELWDRKNRRFIYTKEYTLTLKHSLVSISKWEAKWKKPFLSDTKKTDEEIRDYILCMNLTQNVDPECVKYLTNKNIKEVKEYIDDSMTATWFGNKEVGPTHNRVITSELLYCWMIQLNIPMECEKWHLNRLITLIKTCSEENKTKDKLPMKDAYKRHAALNAARRPKKPHK